MDFLREAGLRGVARMLVAAVLASGVAGAQVGPPSCPVSGGTNGAPSHPTVASTVVTAEASAADPSVLVAAEPMENFGVARYRLEDYADCTGTGGCYWKDMEAQARRAETALERVIATKRRARSWRWCWISMRRRSRTTAR